MTEKEYIERIERLEAELAHEREGRKLFQSIADGYTRGEMPPFEPPTPEEIDNMINGPRGRPITEIIAELERSIS